MLRRLVCFLFGHTPPPGCTRARAIAFECHRCGQLARGDLALKRPAPRLLGTQALRRRP